MLIVESTCLWVFGYLRIGRDGVLCLWSGTRNGCSTPFGNQLCLASTSRDLGLAQRYQESLVVTVEYVCIISLRRATFLSDS